MNIIQNILSKLSENIAIDLGTANIRILINGKEIIKEPSVVAINTNNGKILAIGNDAKQMIGRTPANIVAIQPLKNGVISDFNATEALIHYFIEKSKAKMKLISQVFNPVIVIGVPSIITEVEIKAVIDSAKSAGARKVFVIEEPIAAAIGAGLDIEQAQGCMIVDIGGGTTDIAIMSLGGILIDNSIKVAGDEMDKSIIEYIQNKYNLFIGLKMAEDVKKALASAIPKPTNSELQIFQIKGQDMLSGLPKSTEVNSYEISEAISPVIEKILNAIKEAIEKTPPEIIGDLISEGIVLTGGGALIHNLDKFLAQKLKIKVIVAKDPILNVVQGISKILDNIDLLERIHIKDLILK